jgi:DNA gyrase subunit A
MKAVNGDEDCMIMTDSGIVIRITLKQVSVYNRSAQGVKVINVKDDQKVSTVAILEPEEEDLEEDLPEEPENNN